MRYLEVDDTLEALPIENFYKELLDLVNEGVYFVNQEKKILYWNKRAEEITGFTQKEVLHQSCSQNILNHIDGTGENLCESSCPLHLTNQDGKSRNVDVFLHHKEGHRIPVNIVTSPYYVGGEIVGTVEQFKVRKNAAILEEDYKTLQQLAHYDMLTGLPNRKSVTDHLEAKLKAFKNEGGKFGLLYMDIDDFSQVNNRFGHLIGDEVLKAISKSFLHFSDQDIFIGRWGGEEFIALVEVKDLQALKQVADDLRIITLHSQIRNHNFQVEVTMSIGGTMVADKDTKCSLINRADQQMYTSKNNGKNQVSIG